MGCWIKYFSDNTSLSGTDDEEEAQQVSWRHSRMSEIVSVESRDDKGQLLRISGSGEYWQSQDFLAPFIPGATVKSERIKRRISRKIETIDVSYDIYLDNKMAVATFYMDDRGQHKVPEVWWGQWFNFEMNLLDKTIQQKLTKGYV